VSSSPGSCATSTTPSGSVTSAACHLGLLVLFEPLVRLGLPLLARPAYPLRVVQPPTCSLLVRHLDLLSTPSMRPTPTKPRNPMITKRNSNRNLTDLNRLAVLKRPTTCVNSRGHKHCATDGRTRPKGLAVRIRMTMTTRSSLSDNHGCPKYWFRVTRNYTSKLQM
jgi:hypothetical protein